MDKKSFLYELLDNEEENPPLVELSFICTSFTYEYIVKEILQDTPKCGIVGNSPIIYDGNNIGILNAVCDRCVFYIMKDLINGITKPVTQYNVAPNTYFDDCSWSDTMKETFGTDDCIEMLGIGISIYTQKMRDIYGEEVKRIIDKKTKDIIEPLLKSSEHAYFKSAIPVNKSNVVPPNTTDEYSDIIEMWKNEIQNKTKWNKNDGEKTFAVTPMLADDKFQILHKALLENGYIAERTTWEILKSVLGGSSQSCDNYEPVIWIKERPNNTCCKRSVLNFLKLLNISSGITSKRLNYCFICKSPSNKYRKFESNDLHDYKSKKDSMATSEFNEELKDIIKSALGEEHFIIKQWDKNNLDEKQ